MRARSSFLLVLGLSIFFLSFSLGDFMLQKLAQASALGLIVMSFRWAFQPAIPNPKPAEEKREFKQVA